MKFFIVKPRKVLSEMDLFDQIFTKKTVIKEDEDHYTFTISNSSRDNDKVIELIVNFGYIQDWDYSKYDEVTNTYTVSLWKKPFGKRMMRN